MLKDFLTCLTKVVTTFLLVVVCTLMFVAGVVYLVPATSAVLVEELGASADLLPLLVSWAPAALAATVLEVAGMLAAARAMRRASVKLNDMLCKRIERRFGKSDESVESDGIVESNGACKSDDSNNSASIEGNSKRRRKRNKKRKREINSKGKSEDTNKGIEA